MTQLDDQLADRIIEVMNRLIRADKTTVAAMLATRFHCNKAFADDPTVQVAGYGRDAPTVSMLGVLNGLAGILPEGSERPGWGRVAAVFEVTCPIHGEGLAANDGSKVGSPCMLVGCAAVLELGSLVRFERTEKDPLATKSVTVPVIPDAVQLIFPTKETVIFDLPEGYERLSMYVHMECMHPVFREVSGNRVRTADDCKCDDGKQS